MAKKAEVIITCDASIVKKVLEGVNNELEKSQKRRQELKDLQQQGTKLTRQEERELAQLIKYEAALEERQAKITGEMKKYGEVMKDLAGSKTKDLKRALNEVKRSLENMSAKDANREKLVADLKKIQAQIDANTGAIKRQQSAWGSLGTTMKNLFAYAGIFAGFNILKSKIQEAYELNKKFSDQMANVRKVSGLEMQEIAKLSNQLSNVDSRTSLSGLMDLSYVGAKLGFGNYGIEGLESFAKAAVKVSNALNEDMGPESMTHLSKMVEVMGLIPKMGVEKAMDATGSAIFKLASTSTATGTNIVEFSKRLMGLANIAHITVPELLAIGSAADSMALMPEVAATAFNKLITAVQKQPNLIENALHIEPGTISALFQAGQMTDALVMIFEKMREKGGMNALMQSGVFKDLGSDGARLVAVMATMANRVDILQQHLQTSRDAFSEATAVAQEYAIQMETAAAYSERAANIWEKTFVNPEGVDIVKEFTKAWYETSKALTSNEVAMAQIKFLLTGILYLMKVIIGLAPALLNGAFFWGAARFSVSLRKSLELAKLSAEGLTFSLKGLKAAWTSLSAVAKANWIGVAVTAVAALISVFGMLNKKVEEATGYLHGFKKTLGDLDNEYAKGELELRRYRKAIDEANVGTKQRAAAISQFNNKYKPYLSKLLTEKSTALDVAKAYQEICKQMRTKLALQLKEKDINEQVLPREQWTAERRTEYDRLAREAGYSQYGSSWITGYAQDNASKSVDTLLRDIGKTFYNLPSQVLDEIMTQANSGARRFNNYGNIINSKYLKQANALLAAGSYIRQDRAAINAMNAVNKKWKPEQDAMDAMLATQNQQETIDALQDAPDKNADKELRKQQQEYKQQLRKDLKDAKEESDAIISKIEEWYRLQETVLTDMAADGRLTQEQADQAIRTLNIAKNQALRDARLAISGRDTAAWEKTKQQIGNFMIDQGEWSQQLLAQILDVSMKSIRDNLSRIDKGGGQFGITTSSLRDAVDKNAAGNQREIARLMNKSSEEVEKLLERYNYLEQATKLFEKNLVQIGVLSITTEQLQNQLQGVPDAKATTDATMSMLAALLQQGTKLFAVNPSDATAVAEAIREVVYKPLTESDYLAGRTEGQQAKWFDMFPAIKDWMANPEKHKQELENFYNVVLIAEQDYYTKRKQSYQNASKQMENRFRAAGYTDQEQRIDTQLQGEATTRDNGVGATFWEQQGLGSIADDPEIKRIQNRIYWRQQEVKAAEESLASLKEKQAEQMQLARDRQASDEELQEIEREQALARMGLEDLLHEKKTALFERETELTSKVAQELQKRIQTINNLTKPVQDAANNVGKKLGEMIAGAKEESITWEQIWKSMAIAVGESVIDMMAAYAQNLIMEKAMNAQSKSEAIEKAEVDVAAGTASAASKTLGTLGWWGIALIPVIAALLKGLLQSAFATANKNSSSGTKVKLVSGMLTYDEGNVGQYVGNDGNVYTARQQSSVPEGVSLVSQPIATTINGQPSLVAEKGPEIVIGRRTTRQIMMNEPALLHHLANYGGGGMRRLYDEGNVGDVIGNDGTLDMTGGSDSRGVLDGETAAALRALPAAMAAFSQMMGTIQKQGIPAKMARFGEGSLDEGMRDVEDYRRRYPRS